MTLKEKIAELKKLDQYKDLADNILQELAQAQLDKEAAEAAKSTAEEAVLELNEKLSDLENNPAKLKKRATVTIGKKKYQVMIPKLEIPGVGVVTIADVRENKIEVPVKDKKVKLVEYLKQVNSGMLHAVSK